MLDRNELMIGNLVNVMYDNNLYEVISITKLVLVLYSKQCDKLIPSISFSSCKPIPLTEEWLLKFGEIKGYSMKIVGDHVEIWKYVPPRNKMILLAKKKFVHEYQNLIYSLTGNKLYAKMKNKIITNFDYPPIPISIFDWSAIRENYDEGDPIGYGSTEQEAIDDLKEQEIN